MLASRIGSFEGLEAADLFAGTGALGLEALSRGAAHCPRREGSGRDRDPPAQCRYPRRRRPRRDPRFGSGARRRSSAPLRPRPDRPPLRHRACAKGARPDRRLRLARAGSLGRRRASRRGDRCPRQPFPGDGATLRQGDDPSPPPSRLTPAQPRFSRPTPGKASAKRAEPMSSTAYRPSNFERARAAARSRRALSARFALRRASASPGEAARTLLRVIDLPALLAAPDPPPLFRPRRSESKRAAPGGRGRRLPPLASIARTQIVAPESRRAPSPLTRPSAAGTGSRDPRPAPVRGPAPRRRHGTGRAARARRAPAVAATAAMATPRPHPAGWRRGGLATATIAGPRGRRLRPRPHPLRRRDRRQRPTCTVTRRAAARIRPHHLFPDRARFRYDPPATASAPIRSNLIEATNFWSKTSGATDDPQRRRRLF